MFMKGGSFFFTITYERKVTMKLFKQVLERNKKILILYLLIGISMTFLELYLVTYYQKILDGFQYKIPILKLKI